MEFLNPIYSFLISASSGIRFIARQEAGLRYTGKDMTFGFGNLVLPFASLPDGTVSYSSPVLPAHLHLCAHGPSPTAPSFPLLRHPLYYMCQALSFISNDDIRPTPYFYVPTLVGTNAKTVWFIHEG